MGCIRRSEFLALKIQDPLEKITALYNTYRCLADGHVGYRDIYSHVKRINRKEDRTMVLTALSDNKTFWPEDVSEHIKAYFLAKRSFFDSKDTEDRILNNILDKLEVLPAGKKKNQCFFILLDKDMRAAYPKTRERLFTLYTNDVVQKLGIDDCSQRYQNRLAVYLKSLEIDGKKSQHSRNNEDLLDLMLSHSISLADKYLLMRQLSNAIMSQEQTSRMIKDSFQVKLNSEDMFKSYFYGVGVDFLTETIYNNPDIADMLLKFLNSKGEGQDCLDASTLFYKRVEETYSEDYSRPILQSIKPANFSVLYENFWSAPLKAQSLMLSRILESAVKGTTQYY
jgi:hypothetical protein